MVWNGVVFNNRNATYLASFRPKTEQRSLLARNLFFNDACCCSKTGMIPNDSHYNAKEMEMSVKLVRKNRIREACVQSDVFCFWNMKNANESASEL